jgi:hypothetical protein
VETRARDAELAGLRPDAAFADLAVAVVQAEGAVGDAGLVPAVPLEGGRQDQVPSGRQVRCRADPLQRLFSRVLLLPGLGPLLEAAAVGRITRTR